MAWLAFIITVPLTVFSVLFALSNTGDVTVSLMPLEHPFTLPLYQLGLGLLGAGFFCGALFVWLHDQKMRFKGWKEARRADRLEKELDDLRKKDQDAAATTQAPALPGTR